MDSANLDSSALENSSGIVTLDEERRLWRAMKSNTKRIDIGLRCGLDFKVHTMGLIGYIMMNASSIQSAIEHYEKYQELIGDSMGLRVEQGFNYTRVYIDLWSFWNKELRFTMDMFAAAIFSWIKKNSVQQSCPLRVGFNFPKPENIEDYKQIFSPAKINFGCKTSYLTYTSCSLQSPVIGANKKYFKFFHDQLRQKYISYLNQDTITYKVEKVIRAQIDKKKPAVHEVADQLHTGVRSLQRALKEESTSYQLILDKVRRKRAIELLERGGLSISEIAYKIGYSEVSTFSRSFKKWTGFSPSSYKES